MRHDCFFKPLTQEVRCRPFAVIASTVVLIAVLVGGLAPQAVSGTVAGKALAWAEHPLARRVTAAASKVGGQSAPKNAFESNDAKVQPYDVPYLWQARSYTAANADGEGWFRTVVGKGISKKAIIGTRTGDFNADGKKDQLVVRWNKGTVRLEVTDQENCVLCKGKVAASDMSLTMDKLPLSCKGDLDVLVDDKDRIFVQYWTSPTGIASGIEWSLSIFEPKGTSLVQREVMQVGGSALFDMDEIRSALEAEGIPSKTLPTEDRESYAYLSSPFADHERSLQVVTRITTTDDDFLRGTYKESLAYEAAQIMSSDAEEWSDPRPMGRLKVTPSEIR